MAEPTQRRFRAGAPPQPGAKVLVVDDEHSLTDSTVQILSKSGYRTQGVYNADAALHDVRTWHPQLVLMDILLPGLSGVDAALQMLSIQPRLRIILMSGQAGATDLLASARARGVDLPVLIKPIAPPELLDVVRGALARD